MAEPKMGDFVAYQQKFIEELNFFAPSDAVVNKVADECLLAVGVGHHDAVKDIIILSLFAELKPSGNIVVIEEYVRETLKDAFEFDLSDDSINLISTEFGQWLQGLSDGYKSESEVIKYVPDGQFSSVPV